MTCLSTMETRGIIYVGQFVAIDMKECIYHFAKWQIHPFISKGIHYSQCPAGNERDELDNGPVGLVMFTARQVLNYILGA